MDPRPPFVGQAVPLPPIPANRAQFPQPQIPPQQLPQHLPPQVLPPQQPVIPLVTAPAPASENPPILQDPPTKRRRTSATTGSRGVSNLTPEQLAKKRANDREAQRAIRERTKTQIETLEKKIEELTTQKPYQELQDALRQKQIIEAENQEIKKRLASVLGLIQPVLGNVPVQASPAHRHSSNGLTTPTITTSEPPPGPSSAIPPQAYDNGSVRSSASATSNYPSPSNLKQTPPMNFPPQPGFQPVNTYVRHSSSQSSIPNRPQDDKLALDFLMQSRHSSRDSHSQRERTASTPTPTNIPMDTLSRTAPDTPYGINLPVCAMPIRNILPTCPLDTLLLDFLADRRKEALNGLPLPEIIGPPYPSFTSLINAARRPYTHALSKIFTDMLATFPDISTLPEQVAILHMMFLLMRFCLSPTQENYDRLPTWFQPRPTQLLTPHPAWLDYLPWPRMRDALCTLYPYIPFDEFFIPYTTTVSLNWPYDPKTVLIPAKTRTGSATSAGATAAGMENEELVLNPDFEKHLLKLESWSLGPAFAKAHPRLAGTVRIHGKGTPSPRVSLGAPMART